MRTPFSTTASLRMLCVVVCLAIGCASDTSPDALLGVGKAPGAPSISADRGLSAPGSAAATHALTEDEEGAILFMREEEKLAFEEYVEMQTYWKEPIFKKIAESEDIHMAAVKTLIDRYGLIDPALGPGEFGVEELQSLYNQLVAQGAQSLQGALEAGVTIEETDIDDLDHWSSLVERQDVEQVFTNLQDGSFNHLAAFQKQLAALDLE